MPNRYISYHLASNDLPNSTIKPVLMQATKNENWSTGLCDCCSGPNQNCCCFCFCCASCFPWIAQPIIMQELGLLENCFFSAFCNYCSLLGGNIPFLLCASNLRYQISNKMNYKESFCCSFCITCCCLACSLSQMERDLKDKGYKFKSSDQDWWVLFGNILGNPETINTMAEA